MVAEFWPSVAQTAIGSAIGSALGFVFGIFAFHLQQRHQADRRAKDDWRAALDVLNRLTTTAGANIEALANSKRQFINDLRPEVEKMKAASDEVYNTSGGERTNQIQDLKVLSESMVHFYMSLPEISVMAPPEFGEYSSLSKDMPALTLFVHRAMGETQKLNEYIRSRNALIAQFARENGTGDGMTAERIKYYSAMLSGQGEAICKHTDFALDFWRLVLDQIKAYMTAKANGEHFLEYTLLPVAEEAMPEEELFPLMRKQLTTFGD